jgi:hypothetical protein
LAALAGSGGRALTGSDGTRFDVGACSHNICGRKLLKYAQDHGSPQIPPKDDIRRQLYEDSSSSESSSSDSYICPLDMGSHNLKTASEFTATAEISTDNQLVVKVESATLTAEEAAADECTLTVTPSIYSGSDTEVTSVTFNPAKVGENDPFVAAGAEQVSTAFNQEAGATATTRGGHYKVTVPNPALDGVSLGYVGHQMSITFGCKRTQDGAADGLTTGAADIARDKGTDGKETSNPLIVQHKYEEHATDLLTFVPEDAAKPITGNTTLRWDQNAHNSLPVQLDVSSTFRTEAGRIRFPAGEWSDFGEAKIGDGSDAALLSCELDKGTVDSGLGLNPRWFDTTVNTAKTELFDTTGKDIVEDGCDATTQSCVAVGRKHSAEIIGDTTQDVGFQIPLQKYYAADKIAKMTCNVNDIQTGDDKVYKLTSTQEDLKIPTADAIPEGEILGQVNKGLNITQNAAFTKTADYGQAYFTADSMRIFGEDDMFTLGGNGLVDWKDLTARYDYMFQLKYKNSGVGVAPATTDADVLESGANGEVSLALICTEAPTYADVAGSCSDSAHETQAACEGASATWTPVVKGVSSELADKITGYQALTFARPTLYGETRHTYHIDTATSAAEFRRNSSNIVLDVAAQSDSDDKELLNGRADYKGSARNTDAAVNFPGWNEDWKPYSASVASDGHKCTFCIDSSANNARVVPQTPYIWADDGIYFEFYHDYTIGQGNHALLAPLFENAASFNSHACTRSVTDTAAWCYSSTIAGDSANIGDATAFQCNDMNVTYTMDIHKAAKDDRVQQAAQAIRKFYEIPADQGDGSDGDPVLPITQPLSDPIYRFAGDALQATIADVKAESTDTGDVTLDYTSPDTTPKGFSCDGAVEDDKDKFTYTAPFKKVCDSRQTHIIEYAVKSQFIYKNAQVLTNEALIGDAAATGAGIVEHALQHTGVDVTFDVVPVSPSDFILPLNDITVEVSGTGVPAGACSNATHTTQEACVAPATWTPHTLSLENGGCVEKVAGKSLTCTISGYQIAGFDAGDALHDDEDCSTDAGAKICSDRAHTTQGACEAAGATWVDAVQCPAITVEVKADFGVPKLSDEDRAAGSCGDSAYATQAECKGADATWTPAAYLHGAYQVGVGADDTCDSVKPRVVGETTLVPKISGTSTIHQDAIRVFAVEGSQFGPAFATVAEVLSTDTKSTGKDGEYFTQATMQPLASYLPQDMTDLKLKFEVDKDSGDTTYKFNMIGHKSGDPDHRYDVEMCTGFDFSDCHPAAFSKDGTVPSYITGSKAVYLMIIKSTGGDPCHNKFLDDKAYSAGGKDGIEFQVAAKQGNEEIFHNYRMDIFCHTADPTPQLHMITTVDDDGKIPVVGAWNKGLLEFEATGSTLDKNMNWVVERVAGVLSDGAVGFLQDENGAPMRTQQAVVTFAETCRYNIGIRSNLELYWATPWLKSRSGGMAEGEWLRLCNSFPVSGNVKSAPQECGFAPQSIDVKCPTNEFKFVSGGMGIRADQLVSPKWYGDIFGLSLKVQGRDADVDDKLVFLRPATEGGSSPQREIVKFAKGEDAAGGPGDITHNFYAAFPYTKLAIREDQEEEVLFRVSRDDNQRISCTTMQLKFSVYTSKDEANPQSFQFFVRCPRQHSTTAVSDKLHLDYSISAFLYDQADMKIELPALPSGDDLITGLTSTAAFGTCDGNNALAYNTGCGLDSAIGSEIALVGGGDNGLQFLKGCGGTLDYAGTAITATAIVAREYSHTGGDDRFATSKFCGETDVAISVEKTADKYVAVSVSQAQTMQFDVQVAELEWETCGASGTDSYRLKLVVHMMRKFGGEDWKSALIKSFMRVSDDFTFVGADGTTALSDTADGGAQLTGYTTCALLKDIVDEQKTASWTMQVDAGSSVGYVDHFSSASVAVQLIKPQLDVSQSLEFSATTDVTTELLCGNPEGAITATCDADPSDENKILLPAYKNIKITIGVSDTEDKAFDHTYSAPLIKKGSSDACALFGGSGTACDPVSGLDIETYGAVVDTSGNFAELVSGDNSVVQLSVMELANKNDVRVGWTVTRTAKSDPSRRLRSVEHVTYSLGADGSVSKSSVFAVLPAVRESDGASAVTTKEQITEQYLDANGNADGEPGVYNRTTVEHEKTGEDHTLAVLGIVFGGIGSIAAIAVAFFVGCASRRDASGAGSSFKTVAGGFSDRQPLFNRNRFAPSDF